MTDGLKWTVNHVPGSDDKFLDLMSEENVTKQMNSTKVSPVLRNTTAEAFLLLLPILGVKRAFTAKMNPIVSD